MKFYQIKFTKLLKDPLDCKHCPYCNVQCLYYYDLPNYYACCIKETRLSNYPNRPDWCPAKEIEEEECS